MTVISFFCTSKKDMTVISQDMTKSQKMRKGSGFQMSDSAAAARIKDVVSLGWSGEDIEMEKSVYYLAPGSAI